MHLSHGSTCTDENSRTAGAQFTAITCFSIGGGNVRAIRTNKCDVIIMKPTKIHLDESIQRFCAYKITCTAPRDETRDLSDSIGRGWIEDHNVIETSAVGEFLAEVFIISRS